MAEIGIESVAPQGALEQRVLATSTPVLNADEAEGSAVSWGAVAAGPGLGGPFTGWRLTPAA